MYANIYFTLTKSKTNRVLHMGSHKYNVEKSHFLLPAVYTYTVIEYTVDLCHYSSGSLLALLPLLFTGVLRSFFTKLLFNKLMPSLDGSRMSSHTRARILHSPVLNLLRSLLDCLQPVNVLMNDSLPSSERPTPT